MNLANAKIVTSMPAVDTDRARDFYTNKLGLKEVSTSEPGGIMFEAGDGNQIFLYKRESTSLDPL